MSRCFYRWLLREGVINADPSVHLESPRQGRSLPKSLSEDDVERLLNAPNLESDIEFRDRTMLELLYACGLRVSELTRANGQSNQRESRGGGGSWVRAAKSA